jgi:hypothetical protein
MREYSSTHFPGPQEHVVQYIGSDIPSTPSLSRKIYPNAIVIVASWPTIRIDDNDPPMFTSAVGKTIFSLKPSNLVDPERTNVIVAVTKSMASWSDYEDDPDDDAKAVHWKEHAKEKKEIIIGLQQKVFPTTKPWDIVFIENGGGSNVKHRRLPNGDLSHQNLFDAIRQLFSADGENMAQDLVGMHALRLITGANCVLPHIAACQRKILCKLEDGDRVPDEDSLEPVSLRNCPLYY